MGMSTNLVGVVDTDGDGHFLKMVAVGKACDAAGINYPVEFYEWLESMGVSDPSEIKDGLTVGLMDRINPRGRIWQSESSAGMEIDVKNIPPNIKTIRFYNSW